MRTDVVLRWTARVWGIASALILLAFAFGGRENVRPTLAEFGGLLLFPIGVMVGFGVAWWREALGGLVTVGSLTLFYLWMFNRDGRLPAGPYFLIFAAPGFLFIASALLREWNARRTSTSTTTTAEPPYGRP